MLEYIPDAQRLDVVDPNTVTLSAARSLIDAAQKIDELGVSHRDYNPGNILFSHGRGVIIDFGGCNIVREDESEEDWRAVVRLDSNVLTMKWWIRKLLKKSGLKIAFMSYIKTRS
jgi:serine/threonine protein kinase